MPTTEYRNRHGIRVTVQAEEPAPGLLIYEIPVEARHEACTTPWRITHHTGLIIAAAPDYDTARIGVELIAPLTDWTQTPDELTGSSTTGPARVDANDVDALLYAAGCDLMVRTSA